MVKPIFHLLIIGYYYRKNYGDDLLQKVAQKLLSIKYQTHGYQLHTQFISSEDIKTVPEQMTELVQWADKIVLFGGEVLNSYFLDKLIFIKNYAIYNMRKNIPFYAVGVSINEDYATITPKLDLFETIIFRNETDYQKLLPRLTNKYSLSLPDPVFLLKTKKPTNQYFPRGKTHEYLYNVGFFLSQTAKPSAEYIQSILQVIRYWFHHKARVFLFTMCNGSSPGENDVIINSYIFNELNYFEKEKCVFLDNPQVIADYILEIDFAICWRFHAHIFCIQNKIPFLSISKTPKVLNLLLDNKLEQFNYTEKPILSGIDLLIEKRQEIKKTLETIFIRNYERAQDYKNWHKYLFRQRSLPRFYIDPNNPILMQNLEAKFTNLINNQNVATPRQPLSPADISTSILYLITGKTQTEYHWGLTEKIRLGADFRKLQDDIRWLIREEIKIASHSFYKKMAELLGIENIIYTPIRGIEYSDIKNDTFLNIHYVDQNDMRGVHRSGWQYVIDNIERRLATHNPTALLCDLYLDRSFHWNLAINKKLGIIPYTKPWIGFIHHTCNTEYSNYNTVELFNKPEFLQSLVYCKGLIVLSVYLRKMVSIIVNRLGYNVPVYSLTHPTEFLDESQQFNYNQFLQLNEKRIVQVGAWYRDIEAVYKLTLGQNPLKMYRYALKGPNMDSYYSNKIAQEQISRDMRIRGLTLAKTRAYALEKPVEIINNLSASDYDTLFKTSIIFIRLIDASAVNTIIEAIVRNTPILVNPLEAVIEYLGKDYPFYYNSMDEATRKLNDPIQIRKTFFYLKKLDKTNLSVETFIGSLKKLDKKTTKQ